MADYNYIVKSIFNAKPKYNVSFDRANGTVNIGGVGYRGGSLSRAFKSSGSSSDILNNFFKANKNPQKTKREVEKISKGKIKVSVGKGYGNEPIVYYSLKESVNEAIGMSQSDRNKIYHKLNKGDKVRIKFGNAIRKGNEGEFIVSKGKTKVGKQRVERITLKNVKNPSGVKYYLYNRNNNIGMAQGDMGAVIEDMKIVKESVNERYRPNLDSKGWEAAQKVIRQLQSSVFRKLDDDELLEFRKAIADAFNLDGVLKETTINERKVTKTFHFKGKTYTDMDEIDADFSRKGIKSKPDFNNRKVTVTGDERKIDKIAKFYRGIEETTINERRGGMDVIRRIVKNHQHEGGVDVQTANMILKVYDGVDDKTKKFLDHATLKQIVGLILKSRRR